MARHLFLLKELVKRDFQGRYAGSLLGFVWSLVQPLWLLALFTFVFATVMKVHPVGARTESFAVFLFAGLAPWMAIHEGVVRGATAITDNAQLVKKLSFPSEVLVLTVVLVALLHQAIALGIFVVVLALLGELSPATLPLLALAVPLQVAITLGLGLLAASAQVFFRDTSQVLGLLLQGWFYLTPIVYPLAWVPERFRGALELNPLTPLVDLYRQSLLGPDLAPPRAVAGLAVTAAVALALGLWVFRRVKPAFVDEI
jgi:lipopolysaccharide transport system permease protein